jgi:cation diffusion facilitator CzcD-associated flavoprotein CzcO
MHSLTLQVQGWHYEFPGYPWPKGTTQPYPTGQEVQDYIVSYAHDSGVYPHVQLNTDVLSLTPVGQEGAQGWNIKNKDGAGK